MRVNTDGNLGDILGIWAHPDDEAWLSAGLMMKAVESGRRVSCVTATKGEAGFPDDDPRPDTERMAVRAAEMERCLALLGVGEHQWLGYPDGGCRDVPPGQVVPGLADLITAWRPDTVLTFGPDGGTGHTDHIAVSRWATEAVRLAGLPGTRLLYATKTRPWSDLFASVLDPALVMMSDDHEPETVEESELAVWLCCDEDLVARKVAAMRAQESQIEPFYQMVGAEPFGLLVRDEFFRDVRPSDPVL